MWPTVAHLSHQAPVVGNDGSEGSGDDGVQLGVDDHWARSRGVMDVEACRDDVGLVLLGVVLTNPYGIFCLPGITDMLVDGRIENIRATCLAMKHACVRSVDIVGSPSGLFPPSTANYGCDHVDLTVSPM